MAINLPNPGLYQQQLGQEIKDLRDALNALLEESQYLASIGGAATLEAAPFNYDVPSAQLIMNTIGTVTPTNPTVIAVENFCNAAAALWGGGK